MFKRTISSLLIVILLVLSIDIVTADDIIPPITSIQYDPPSPTGKEGWYNCTVNITLLAIDNESGVNATYYRLNNESWQNYTGIISLITEGKYDIDFFSIDYAGNIESIKSALVKIDKTKPNVKLYWHDVPGTDGVFYEAKYFYSGSNDELSEIDRVDFYINGEFVCSDYFSPYEYTYFPKIHKFYVIGPIILQRIGSRISAFGLAVKILTLQVVPYVVDIIGYDNAGNHLTDCLVSGEVENYRMPPLRPIWVGLRFFVHLTLPNNYSGTLTPFWVNAYFYRDNYGF